MRVAIIGGGIIGLYTAHFLSKRGMEPIVFEKSTPGSGSTGRSGGGIRSQFSTPTNVELSAVSREYWDEFEETFDADIRRRQPGYLFVARNQETAESLASDVEMQNRLGIDSEYITPERARELSPGLRIEELVGASYSPRDEFVDPHLVTMALVRALEDDGVDIRRQTKVTDVVTEGGETTGVRTRDGQIDADAVVNAAGPWAERIAAMADVDLPIKPELHRIAFVRPEGKLSGSIPLTMDLDTGAVFRPEDDETVAIGGGSESPRCDPDSFPRSATLEWTHDVLEGVTELSDRFGPGTEVCNTMSGLYATTPDAHPVLEETRPGFVNVVGFSGHGFMHAPAAGKLVTELLCDGSASTMEIGSLSSERFEDGTTMPERSVI